MKVQRKLARNFAVEDYRNDESIPPIPEVPLKWKMQLSLEIRQWAAREGLTFREACSILADAIMQAGMESKD